MIHIYRLRIKFAALFTTLLFTVILFTDPQAESAAPPTLTVYPEQITHTISRNIYGANIASEEQAEAWQLPVNRWGGNAVTRYNWQIDVFNPGNHWFYENLNNYDPGTLPIGSAADRFVQQNQSTGTATLMQVPMMGWVPKDRSDACGFSQAKYGAQSNADWQWRPDCGNGIDAATGQPITGTDPTDTSVAIDGSFIADWVQHLVAQHGTTANGGVNFYALDNEPMIWWHNHGDVRSEYTSFVELRDRAFEYGAAIKSADSTANIIGPTVWGWSTFFYSSLDTETPNSNPDHDQYGDFIPWYLQQMSDFEQANGYRLLDYLDVHFYPQGFFQKPDGSWDSIMFGEAADPASRALRLRSTHDLFDPTYISESWINQPAMVIPRLQGWIDQHYPGTKLSFSEYSWGAAEDMNGALAQADVLGIFGREAVDMAMLWPTNPEAIALGTPLDYVFRLFGNYDGVGSRFGDQSVTASSSEPFDVSIYAARQSGDKLTIMVINKTLSDITTPITLNGGGPITGNVTRYRYSRADVSTIVQSSLAASGQTISDTLPAESITLYEVQLSSVPTAVAVSEISAETTPLNRVWLVVVMLSGTLFFAAKGQRGEGAKTKI